jgi:hypothetical protein
MTIMDKKMLKEILAAHADQLLKGKATSKDYLDLLPESDEELARLLAVAERVQSTLQPVTPANHFEQELKRELLTTAHIRQVEGYKPPNPSRDLFFLVAALGFVISLCAVLVAMRHRQQSSLLPMSQTIDQHPQRNARSPLA